MARKTVRTEYVEVRKSRVATALLDTKMAIKLSLIAHMSHANSDDSLCYVETVAKRLFS